MKQLEVQVVMGTQVNTIARLLSMKGDSRLEVTDSLVEKIQGQDYSGLPGISLRFLETRKKNDDWTEYNVLYQVSKTGSGNAQYLTFIFTLMSILTRGFKGYNIDSIGIQEVECSLPGYYYFLIYIIK